MNFLLIPLLFLLFIFTGCTSTPTVQVMKPVVESTKTGAKKVVNDGPVRWQQDGNHLTIWSTGK